MSKVPRPASTRCSQNARSSAGWISWASRPRSWTCSRPSSRCSSSRSAARSPCCNPSRSGPWSSSVQPLTKLLEAALFAASRPLTLEELGSLDPTAGENAVLAALAALRSAYGDDHGVELVEIAEGWQFLTRREYAETIERAQFALRPRRLSPAALETLAIIAY